jgi:hypothetical protein
MPGNMIVMFDKWDQAKGTTEAFAWIAGSFGVETCLSLRWQEKARGTACWISTESSLLTGE